MAAHIDQALLDEWVIDSRFVQVVASYRQYALEGRKGEFLNMLLRSLKCISLARRGVWKDFLDVTVPALDKDVAEYKALREAFGKPKEKKATPPRRKR